jgi:predicted RNase H-like nuclease (RuvC/YqgF family)
MIDKVSLDKFITGEGNDEYENQYTMDGYEQQYKESQDAVRKYAEEVRELEKEIKAKDTIIKNLKKVVGEINREEKENG